MKFLIFLLFLISISETSHRKSQLASVVKSIFIKIDNSTENLESELNFLEKVDRSCLYRELSIENQVKYAETIEIDGNFAKENGKLIETLDFTSQFCLMMKSAVVDLSNYKSDENKKNLDCFKVKLNSIEPFSKLTESINHNSNDFDCLNSTDQCSDTIRDYSREEKITYEKMVNFSCSFTDFLQVDTIKRLCWMAVILANDREKFSEDFVQTALDEMTSSLFSVQRNKLECIIDDLNE